MTDATEPARGAEVWTTRRLLHWMRQRFEAHGVDAPRIVAEMLLAHVLGCERMRLYMEVDRPATPAELEVLRGLVVRASADEPVQYLVGRASFYGREFLIEPCTIIPQPATEDLVGAVLEWCKARGGDAPARIADVGTGCGCIAVSLALGLPGSRVLATDVVPAALDLARRNAEHCAVVDRIELAEGPGLEPLGGAGPFDVICSNPPYISDDEWERGEVDRAVRDHVPETATRGGPDGLDHLRPLIAGAGAHLRPGGLLALEIGHAQAAAVLALVEAAPNLREPRVGPDHEGFDRVLLAERRA